MAGTLRVIPLGGLGEVGKNITVFEDDDDLIVVDCGLTFPREEGMFGVDIVLPDFSYIVERQHKLRAVILTHGHEDHIGALGYLMRQVDVPEVWATRFTLALVKAKIDELGMLDATEWVEIVPEEGSLVIGGFELEFLRVAHSIPDCTAVAVYHQQGTVLHTGDVKLDSTPMDGVQTDLGRFAEIGAEGVDLYLADSTNADIPGHTKSERSVSGPLRDIVRRTEGRVIACCFSSHVHRLQQFMDIAAENNRVVCVMGRSMTRNTNIARNLGYMRTGKTEIIKPNRLGDFEDNQVLVMCTGSQGEPLAAMSRIAWGTHPAFTPHETDTYIFSARTIPGNEVRVHRIVNQLSRLGAHIYHDAIAHVHVSGHAASEELKTLLQLVRPAKFMPVHGEWRHLRAHADLAQMVGMSEEDVLVGENGRVVELKNHRARLTDERVRWGQRLVDRHSREDIVQQVLDDRQQLSGDGVLVVVAHLNNGRSTLQMISRGFVEDDEDELLREARDEAERHLADILDPAPADIQKALQDSVTALVYDRTRRSPLVLPVVIDG